MPKMYFAMKTVIYKDKMILLIKRREKFKKKMWDIPGGGVKFGEKPVVALKREVKEEVGLSIEIIKPISFWTFFKNNKSTQVFGVTVISKPTSTKIKLGKEHSDYKWILPKDVKKSEVGNGTYNDIKNFFLSKSQKF